MPSENRRRFFRQTVLARSNTVSADQGRRSKEEGTVVRLEKDEAAAVAD
jgi:hypothetical protein